MSSLSNFAISSKPKKEFDEDGGDAGIWYYLWDAKLCEVPIEVAISEEDSEEIDFSKVYPIVRLQNDPSSILEGFFPIDEFCEHFIDELTGNRDYIYGLDKPKLDIVYFLLVEELRRICSLCFENLKCHLKSEVAK